MDTTIHRDTIPVCTASSHTLVSSYVVLQTGTRRLKLAASAMEDTQRRLAQDGQGRLTAPPAGISGMDRNWAPTRDSLSELMRLDAVVSKPLPSSRRFVDRYRGETYELTELGMNLAVLTSDGSQFVDALSQRLIAGSPIPPGSYSWRSRRIQFGALLLARAMWSESELEFVDGPNGLLNESGTRHLQTPLRRRSPYTWPADSGTPPAERPSNKALAETTNDALMVAAFAARYVRMDAPTIKTLLRWGSELLLYDQSRYVLDHPDVNLIWLAADLNRRPDEDLLPVPGAASPNTETVSRRLSRAPTDSRPSRPAHLWTSLTFQSTSYAPR